MKEKWVPKIGDRVAMYVPHRHIGIVINTHVFEKNSVGEIFPFVNIKLDTSIIGLSANITCHPKQLRRLVKKKKRKPRECYVNWYGETVDDVDTDQVSLNARRSVGGETLLMREVLK